MKRSGFNQKRPSASTGILRIQAHQRVAKVRMRRCAICRSLFSPRSMTHKACGEGCAKALAEKNRLDADRKVTRIRLQALKPRKWWLAKAKTSMHTFVRARDEGKQCASCDALLIKLGRPGGDYDAGHFRPVGLAKHLEFDPRNIWGQCKHCNDHLRGNFQEYERRLRLREGDAFVDALMADNAPRHLKISDLQEIEATYKQKYKELQA